MGNFSQEKNVLKKFARKGQCFSTSRFICNMLPDQVNSIEDIQRNGFTFTDGVGYISPLLSLEAAQQFRFSQVSAFQIRIGGAKGILMIKNELEGR